METFRPKGICSESYEELKITRGHLDLLFENASSAEHREYILEMVDQHQTSLMSSGCSKCFFPFGESTTSLILAEDQGCWAYM
ncbi:hypothetical protein Y1Q_0010350 [Alligator mississippiensis]|uniref:Uncharacterized protein n=1 Tax=Alligator mississippiensis TaxID=8496 RepID=A0A151NN63_ALLMI|nr:hypothetical protein Y1Q_0010350 [Alligator mississippiensis]